MNIAIFTDSFLPGVGGTEQAILGFASELSKTNSVLVACPSYGKKNVDNFGFHVLRAKSIFLTKNDYYALPCITSNFTKALNNFKPDIIHIQTVSPMASYALKYAKKHDIPTVMTIHTKFKTAFERSIKSKIIVKYLINNLVKKLNFCSKVCTVSKDMINELNSYGFTKECIVVKNGTSFSCDLNETIKTKEQTLKKYNINNSDNVFLFVGHIVKFKNLKLIFDSLRTIKNKIDFKMLFVGDGLDRKYFEELSRSYGLSENCIFTGVISDKNTLKAIYNSADLFLFPSIFDNDPLVVVEAATMGTPSLVIAKTGSSERVVDNINGFISENNVDVFSKKILYLIKNKDVLKQAGKNASESLPTKWSTTTQEYLNIYKDLLK